MALPIDKLENYRRMGVPEVWFWMADQLAVYQLQRGAYQQMDRSQFLPDLDLSLLSGYIASEDQYDAVTEFLAAIAPPLQ